MARRRWWRRKRYAMTGSVRPADITLQRWALREDRERIDESVADDAALQLALRDALSVSFLAFAKRWVPQGQMTPEVFERFASAWDSAQGEKMVAHLGSEVPIPQDIREWVDGPDMSAR